MNEVNLLLSQNPKFKFVEVRFRTGAKTYTYKTMLDVELEEFVLVPIYQDGDEDNAKIKMAKVVSIGEIAHLSSSHNYRWIVQKVDMSHFEHCCEVEENVAKELSKVRAASLRKKLLDNLQEQVGEEGVKLLEASVNFDQD